MEGGCTSDEEPKTLVELAAENATVYLSPYSLAPEVHPVLIVSLALNAPFVEATPTHIPVLKTKPPVMFGPNISGTIGYIRKGNAGGITPSGSFSHSAYWNSLVGSGRATDDWGVKR